MPDLVALFLVWHPSCLLQRGEAKLLTEDWEGAVEDLKEAHQKSPQVKFMHVFFLVINL